MDTLVIGFISSCTEQVCVTMNDWDIQRNSERFERLLNWQERKERQLTIIYNAVLIDQLFFTDDLYPFYWNSSFLLWVWDSYLVDFSFIFIYLFGSRLLQYSLSLVPSAACWLMSNELNSDIGASDELHITTSSILFWVYTSTSRNPQQKLLLSKTGP